MKEEGRSLRNPQEAWRATYNTSHERGRTLFFSKAFETERKRQLLWKGGSAPSLFGSSTGSELPKLYAVWELRKDLTTFLIYYI